jgi:hypothetical protein
MLDFRTTGSVRLQSLRLTPAIAAGMTHKLWSLTDMVRILEDWEPALAAKPDYWLVG